MSGNGAMATSPAILSWPGSMGAPGAPLAGTSLGAEDSASRLPRAASVCAAALKPISH